MGRAFPRRVLMTTDAVGGVWDYALELAGGLARLGTATALAVTGPAPDATRTAAARAIPGITLHAMPGRLEWMPGADDDLAEAGQRLLDLEAVIAPDVVHVNGFAHAALPFGAPVLCAAHSCVRSWWRAVHGEDAPATWRAYSNRVRSGLHAAAITVVPTAALLSELSVLYGPLPRARVVHNGRDPARFAPLPKEPIVLAAGRVWDEGKNIATLDAVAAGLPWTVAVAGDTCGPDGRERPLRNALALGRQPPEEMARWFGRAAVFAHPARYEPFGLAPLEAALSGCALVLGDIPALRELWNGAALFVPPDDRSALANALKRLCTDANRRGDAARRARLRARRYTAGRMAGDYRRAYLSLLRVDAALAPA